jgi:hypothetical protein
MDLLSFHMRAAVKSFLDYYEAGVPVFEKLPSY